MTQVTIGLTKKSLIPPYGDENLIDLLVEPSEVSELRKYSESLQSVSLSPRSVCDLELLATGAFTPLDRFMNSADYTRVVGEMRLSSGHLFPVPITLPVDRDAKLKPGQEITLRDPRNEPLALMMVDEIFEWNRRDYSQQVLGTDSIRHPLVTELASWGDRFISGKLRVLRLPRQYDFTELRLTPTDVRSRLIGLGNPNVVAFQTRNPLHRAHEELTKRAIEKIDGVLLMHPVVGMTKPGDIDHYSRVRTYKALTEKYYDADRVLLSLLPLAMRLAGPREALWHAIIRRNYGANHFIIGRDHASPGLDENGKPFYLPHAALELVETHSKELGIAVVPFEEFVYFPETDTYEERSTTPAGKTFFTLSGTELRRDYLDRGREIPVWFARPEVAEILQESCPARHRQGVCIWFTGLSGAGKSTIAEILTSMLSAYGRRITLLDGDVVRTNLSAGLGFDKAGRDANIRRIGFVGAEIVRHRGVAVCSAISPYRQTRNEVRKMVGENFIEVFVSTPLDICEQRDPKGMYARARAGEIKNFTGIDDIYEPPVNAEIVIDTVDRTAEDNAMEIMALLTGHGFIRSLKPDNVE